MGTYSAGYKDGTPPGTRTLSPFPDMLLSMHNFLPGRYFIFIFYATCCKSTIILLILICNSPVSTGDTADLVHVGVFHPVPGGDMWFLSPVKNAFVYLVFSPKRLSTNSSSQSHSRSQQAATSRCTSQDGGSGEPGTLSQRLRRSAAIYSADPIPSKVR